MISPTFTCHRIFFPTINCMAVRLVFYALHCNRCLLAFDFIIIIQRIPSKKYFLRETLVFLREMQFKKNHKNIGSIQYQEPYARAKKPVFMRVCTVSSVIPTRLRVLSHSYFSPYFRRISRRFRSFFSVFSARLVLFWYHFSEKSAEKKLIILFR